MHGWMGGGMIGWMIEWMGESGRVITATDDATDPFLMKHYKFNQVYIYQTCFTFRIPD